MRAKIGAVIVGGTLGLAFACGGSDTSDVTRAFPGGDPASPPVTTPTATDNPGDRDAATDAATLEGGSNIDLDAGIGVPDAGKCNDVEQRGALVTSTCSSTPPTFSGGRVVAGRYRLTAVTALGGAAFCRNQFVPTGFRETLEIAGSDAAFTVEAVADVANLSRQRTTSTFTLFPGGTSPLAARELCPEATGAAGVPYEAKTESGKTLLTLQLRYGGGAGVYRFERE